MEVKTTKSKADLIQDVTAMWLKQHTAITLCNDLMLGTSAMRAKNEVYLPKKQSETYADYNVRKNAACLDNFFQKTVIFYLGQVFKKEVRYQDPSDENQPENGEKPGFDPDWFKAFQDNVDLAGSNLTVFGKRVFQAGLIDGVSFVLVDYVKVNTATDPETGLLLYHDQKDQTWKPKSLAADEALNLRPYFIHIPASNVMDVWTGIENGAFVIKHFRYEESIEVAKDEDGLERESVKQIMAWWPHKWEKWQEFEGKNIVMVDSGPNALGVIPVSWFMPGEPMASLTARPPLEDLAEQNREYWVASSDHNGRLMPFVRSPAAIAVGLNLAKGETVSFSPNRLITTDNPSARLESVGVDASSACNSQADLKDKREAMRDYGLQTTESDVTATMSDNVATNAASSLKGWVADFKDCLENAHRYAAKYQGWEDGPAVSVNTEFKNVLDMPVLAHLQTSAINKLVTQEYYVSILLSMMPNSDEFTDKEVINKDFGKEDEFSLPKYNDFSFEKQPSVDGKSTPVGDKDKK
jgi:hypothetical protein